MSVSEMQKALSKPERFAGMHFFNPVHLMPLVEVIRGNVYGAQASDGDAFGADPERSRGLLEREILPRARHFAYIEVADEGSTHRPGYTTLSAAYQRVMPDLAQRAMVVPDADEVVATGACLQAAALYRGEDFAGLAEAWGLGAGIRIEPDDGVDVESIRSSYARLASVI